VLTCLGYALVYPGLGVEALRKVASDNRGIAVGTYTAFLDLTLGIGVPLLGLLASIAGLNAVFLASAVAAGFSALVSFFLLRRATRARTGTPRGAQLQLLKGHSMKNIANKVVVITGASSGLGEATARLLAAEGAVVVLGARRLDRLQTLADEIMSAGGRAIVAQTDVTKRAQVEDLVQKALAEYGRVDVILNNAGLMPSSPLERLKVDDWERMIDVNLKGVLYGIAAVLPVMKAQRAGHIVNVSSVAGHKINPGGAVYAATKHAVRALSEGLRMEVKPYNIRTTIISPGAVATELTDSITEPDIASAMKAVYKSAIPAESFARAVAYALSQPDEVDINEILLRPTQQQF
jgi:NADP-dependent 3-hydroxy acid dehydrogenase YdfG